MGASGDLVCLDDFARDPFAAQRADSGVVEAVYSGEQVPMLLRYAEVRSAARDWTTYSSDAPMRVPVPSEEDVRSVRQLPIETDPPRHTRLRALLEPIFRRPVTDAYVLALDGLIDRLVLKAAAAGDIEMVSALALPVQSHALALLLGMSSHDADLWRSWGVSLFRGETDGAAAGQTLEAYLRAQIARARNAPDGGDIFSMLVRARLDGEALSDEEILGITNLTFAGGRDTLIHAASFLIATFAGRRDELRAIAGDRLRISLAVEEVIRFLSPLTHIGRVCPHGAQAGGVDIAPGRRLSLGWAAANRDPAIFDEPGALRLDRSPNPHIGFGSGRHACLGAHQARAVLRSLIGALARHIDEIRLERVEIHAERFGDVVRSVGLRALYGRLSPRV